MKKIVMWMTAALCFGIGTAALAVTSGAGAGEVAAQVTTNVANIARLITALSYVVGMAFVIAAIVKFKAHKDNPTQIPVGTPIFLLFVGAALIFIPTVFKVSGETLFGHSGKVAGISGITSFGAPSQR